MLLSALVIATAAGAVAATPPTNTVAPRLSGTAQDGKILAATKGTWTGTAPITYTYRWQQSTDAGASWNDITGATSPNYTLPAGFAGTQVRIVVTATNTAGSVEASSLSSAVILAAPPVNTTVPSLSGTAQDGKSLTSSRGTWAGAAPISYVSQWQASSDGGLTWTDIAGATATTYTLPAGFGGKRVRVVVTATNGDGTAQAVSRVSAVIAAAPPVATAGPTLGGGAPQDGKMITLNKGTWTGLTPIAYAYQWQTTGGVAPWTDIGGATSTTYTPPAGSAGKRVRVLVTATNGDGTAQLFTPQSGLIASSPPVNTVAPSVGGTAKDGVTLNAVTGTWTGMATIAFTYQWQLSSAGGGGPWSDISGATSSTHTPPAGSAGRRVRFVLTATNGDGSVQVTSPSSAAIVSNPPVNTVAPTLSGTAQNGKVMTVAKGTWTGVAPITYTYQWQFSSDGASWSDIAGATSTTYSPPAGSEGKRARVVITAANGDGTRQAVTAASAVIVANAPVNTVAPSISGTPQDGTTLVAVKGTWSGTAPIAYAYQWQVSINGGATWSDIAGATSTTFTPPAGYAGKQVRVVITATNDDGNGQAVSPASDVILLGPPLNTLAPSLAGTAQDGKTMTAVKGVWSGVSPITYTYQWQVSGDGGASWVDISGATSTTFTPPAGYAGNQVRVIVSATNGDGAGQAMSPASAVILGDPPVNTSAPVASGTAQDGSTLAAARGSWSGMAPIAYAYQWQVSIDGGASWSDIAGATGTSFALPAGFAGKQVRVLITATNPDGSTQAASPATGPILASPPVNTILPSFGGTVQDGQTLTADIGLWSGPPTIAYTYQWQVSADGGSSWSDVVGASAASFVLPAGFAGKQVRVVVTATNADGSTQGFSAASTAILANPPVNTTLPHITGSGNVGQPLTTDSGAWSGVATITFTYQWQFSADGGVTWPDIPGANGSTYTPTGTYAGEIVRVVVTATNGDGTAQAASPSTVVTQSSSSLVFTRAADSHGAITNRTPRPGSKRKKTSGRAKHQPSKSKHKHHPPSKPHRGPR